MNILIVDDELDQVETLRRGLRHRGYGVLEATSPQEALNLLHNGASVDMVITDYIMPLMNGIELLESIRKDYPVLPVIIMTAYGQKDLLVNALHNSCNGYIEKPFTLDRLTMEIERAKENASRGTGCDELVQSIPMLVHQLNNPLMAISGTAEMAMRSLDDPDAVKVLMERILAATKELSELNIEIMNAARHNKKATQIIDINGVIIDSLSMFRDLLASRSIGIRTHFSNNHLFITGHKFDLEQLFKNIILNSIDAVEGKSESTIIVSVKLQKGSSLVEVSIEDTGCGIPESSLDKLFDPYFTMKSKGTGLGLAVAKRVVEEHKGRIEAESQVGKGSTFKVFLPALPLQQGCSRSSRPENE